MRIVLSNQSAVPIYEQIKEQIKTSFLLGKLPENGPLPSIRQLARDLKVSVITTTRAYNDLELEGFIQTVPGKGCYIKEMDGGRIKAQFVAETRAALISAVRQGRMGGMSMEDIHKLLDEVEEDV